MTTNLSQSYSAAHGNKPFDWPVFLRLKKPTDAQWAEVDELAKDWAKCPCGNQHKLIPRDGDGRPEDSILARFGGRSDDESFEWALRQRDLQSARELFDLIELRASHVLRQTRDKARTDLKAAQARLAALEDVK